MQWRQVGRAAVWAAVVATAGWAFLAPALDSQGYQWDLRSYYWAGRAVTAHVNPYDANSLAWLSGGDHKPCVPYVYTPVVAVLASPFARLPFRVVALLWLALKAVSLVALVRLWRRWFIPDADPLLLAAVLAGGFRAATLSDLQCGNVAIVEALLIWWGCAGVVRGRPAQVALGESLAALGKLLPASLLLLLVAEEPERRERWGWVGLAGAQLLLVALGPLLLAPSLASSYLAALRSVHEVGAANPCARSCFDTLAQHWPAAGALWWLYAAAVALTAARQLRRARQAGDRVALVMFTVLAYALLVPRFKCYSYVLVVAPVVWLLTRLSACRPVVAGVLGALVLLPVTALELRPLNLLGQLLGDQWPWVSLLALWLAGCRWSDALLVAPAAAE